MSYVGKPNECFCNFTVARLNMHFDWYTVSQYPHSSKCM